MTRKSRIDLVKVELMKRLSSEYEVDVSSLQGMTQRGLEAMLTEMKAEREKEERKQEGQKAQAKAESLK